MFIDIGIDIGQETTINTFEHLWGGQDVNDLMDLAGDCLLLSVSDSADWALRKEFRKFRETDRKKIREETEGIMAKKIKSIKTCKTKNKTILLL